MTGSNELPIEPAVAFRRAVLALSAIVWSEAMEGAVTDAVPTAEIVGIAPGVGDGTVLTTSP